MHDVTAIVGPSTRANSPAHGLVSREMRGRVTIIRNWATTFAKTRLSARLINLATYFACAALSTFGVERPDVIVAETDPPLLGALGAILKRRWRCRLVYNVRDLYPDIAIVNGGVRSRVLLELLARANRIGFERADLIITLGQDMAERIVRQGVPRSKVAVAPDWADCARIFPLASSPLRQSLGERFVVMYSGNLGLSQQLETVLAAANRLRGDPRILFVLVGEGARKEWLIGQANAMGLANVAFLPYQPREKLAESLSAADLHLVALAPGAAGCGVPSKIYGILAAGRPFVAVMEDEAEAARIARDHSVGLVVAPGDAEGLAATIAGAAGNLQELRAMGARARRLAEQKYDRAVATRKFDALLASLAS